MDFVMQWAWHWDQKGLWVAQWKLTDLIKADSGHQDAWAELMVGKQENEKRRCKRGQEVCAKLDKMPGQTWELGY